MATIEKTRTAEAPRFRLPSDDPSSLEFKIARLEEQIDDLAGFIGRLIPKIYPGYDDFDEGEPHPLVWFECVSDEGTSDEALIGYWVYRVKPTESR